MLKEKIAAIEDQMKAKLKEARATFTQQGDKGASVEDSFRTFLRQYLPRRLGVGNGEIIDSQGGRSKQTDVVIVNEDHPFTFTPDIPGLFFIEGICAACEVKTTLTTTELENALNNSREFKQLEAQLAMGALTMSNPSDRERFYKHPPWFLMAFESQLTLPRIKAKIVEFAKQNSLETNNLGDAVFVLDKGWVINFGDGNGSFQFRSPEGNSLSGWIGQNSDLVLFDLLGWLSIVIPRTVRFDPTLPLYIIGWE